MFSRNDMQTQESQFIFRLEDENDVSQNKCYNYYEFTNDISQNCSGEELFVLKEHLNEIEFFTYEEKEKINDFIQQRNKNGLQDYIYTQLNCVVQIYNYNSQKWIFILDNNNEYSLKQQMKLLEWGQEGSLKFVRESGGMIKEKMFGIENSIMNYSHLFLRSKIEV